MKNIVVIAAFCMLAACGKEVVEKPDNLIPEEKMIEIFYDLSLLEAIKTQKPVALEANNIHPTQYIYKKYSIDSVQFVNSNRYYATDLEKYKRMYEEVGDRLEKNKRTVDSLLVKNGGIKKPEDPDAPQIK